MLRPQSRGLIFLLGALTAVTALAVDMSLPSLPSIAASFGAEPEQVQLTLSLFLVGYAGGQLFCGPLSDRFGRRRVLLAGIAVYALAGFACALSPGIKILVGARLVQGFGACVGPVLGRAVVRDHMTGPRAAQTLSYITLTMSIAPLLAPMLGGLLLNRFGWPAIFVFLGIFGTLLTTATYLFFPESLKTPDRDALRLRRLARNAATFFSSRRALGFALINAFVFAGLFAFLSGSPFVLIEVLGVPAGQFGFYFALSAVGLMMGALVNGRLAHRYSGERVMRGGFVLLLAAAATLVVVAWSGRGGAIAIMLPIGAYVMALGLILPNATAAAMEPMPHMAGLAASIMGAIQMGSGSLSGWGVARLYDGTAHAMAGMLAAMAVCAVLTYLALVRPSPRTGA
ncbi:MAG TPA: Bcr/CflA family multidrug efflux MFS transporter [Stellaceae bacterium]|nr:Bcr/CflA family multidrug efflux MFS transporter [Stellaceae bacterium]